MNDIKIIYSRHNTDIYATKIHTKAIPYYDLTLLLRGTLNYTANGEKLTMRQGDAIFLPPHTLRHREEGVEKSDFISFNFTLNEAPELPLYIDHALSNDVLLLIAAYDELSRRSYLDNNEKYKHLLSCILLILEERITQKKYNPLTLKIMEYIHENLDKKITLEEIGRITFFSPVYCDMVFKKETGHSIIDFLLEERIEEAKRLLADGSLSLSAISELVGFDDYNYFSRVFKKRAGYTPSNYRKRTSSETMARG